MQDINLLDPTGLEKLETFEDVSEAMTRLRNDFDFHNHDGASSRALGNVVADSITTRSAIVGGYKLYEAVVGKTGADFRSVAEALAAGKTRIFVRNGTYLAETPWTISNANTTIVGETMMGVKIYFAQDTVHSGKSVYIDATSFNMQKMYLYNYDSGEQNLFHFTSNGTFPNFDNLFLICSRGKSFSSDNGSGGAVNVYGNISNVFTDLSFTNDIDVMFPFYLVNHLNVTSMIFNCANLVPGSGKTFKVTVSCAQIYFSGCKLFANHSSNEPNLGDSVLNRWVGSYFYGTAFAVNGNFSECMFESNGNTPDSYFVKPSLSFSKVTNCRILSGPGIDILRISGSGIVCTGNSLSGGKRILLDTTNFSIDILGSIFSGNIWVSDYDTASIDINIGNHAVKFCVIGNTIRNNASGGTHTPTITDGGTSTIGVSLNQLILG